MTTAYSSLMGLALPVQGELSGTWGDTVNNGITNYLDVALAGTQTISGSQTAVTLSLTNGNASATNIAQAGSGATGSAQYAIINCTGNPASLLTITVPASSRQYVVINATSTSQSVKVVGVGPTTGVTIVSGEKAHIVWNGSDFVKIASTSSVSSFSAGTTGLTPNSATTGAVTLAGTLATTNGGTGLTSFTANGVMYASSTSALTTGSALTFDGTNLGVGNSSPAYNLDIRATGNQTLAVRTVTSGDPKIILSANGDDGASIYYGRGTGKLNIDISSVVGAVQLNTSGNLGLGVTPSAWISTYRAIDVGNHASVYGRSDTTVEAALTANTYRNSGGSWIYKTTNRAGRFGFDSSGSWAWYQAASGTAGNAITWTQAMTLDASGNLAIGTTSPSEKLHVVGNSRTVGDINAWGSGGTVQARLTAIDAVGYAYVGTISNHAFLFYTNSTERARIDSSGNVGIGLTPVANNGILQLNSYASVQAMMEKATVSATAATGTINFDAATQPVLYYTTNASGNWTINIRGSASLSLNSMMATGQSLTLAFLATNGATAYYQSALTIDGSSVTPKWQGGTAPTAGNASSIDAYVLTVIKTGSATFTVLASQTKFA